MRCSLQSRTIAIDEKAVYNLEVIMVLPESVGLMAGSNLLQAKPTLTDVSSKRKSPRRNKPARPTVRSKTTARRLADLERHGLLVQWTQVFPDKTSIVHTLWVPSRRSATKTVKEIKRESKSIRRAGEGYYRRVGVWVNRLVRLF
jgi:hypothetical protein